jgi:hypothetical protein
VRLYADKALVVVQRQQLGISCDAKDIEAVEIN